jgi:hypothetical protein
MLLALFGMPGYAAAHDDPVLTVRVMCNGFNVLDIDGVLGEISDSATVTVDRTVRGRDEIEPWVKEQMDNDLRIEIVEISAPRQVPEGYTVSWTARFSRQDWRRAGVAARQASNTVVIHNGRITEWTASLDADISGADAAAAPSVGTPVAPEPGGLPDLFGIPMTLVFAVAATVVAASLIGLRLRR